MGFPKIKVSSWMPTWLKGSSSNHHHMLPERNGGGMPHSTDQVLKVPSPPMTSGGGQF